MERDGLGSAFLRVELLRRKLLRPHFIELGLTVGAGTATDTQDVKAKGRDEPERACRLMRSRCDYDVKNA